jgi:hypothetical protein
MNHSLSRRDFLKLSALSLGTLAFRPFPGLAPERDLSESRPVGIVRITVADTDVFIDPDANSAIVRKFERDQLVTILEEIRDPEAMANAPLWYRVRDGYLFSMYTQRVDNRRMNPPEPWIHEEGSLGEITVPFTRAYLNNPLYGWHPVYRLYYESVHWITGVDAGPDGQPGWYQISDESDDNLKYYVPGAHVRLIPAKELTPISPDIPLEQKKVVVSLKDQVLTAYEAGEVVMHTLISSGIPGIGGPNGIPSATPMGRFNIRVKMPSKHMGDGRVTDIIEAYELPGVPWVSFFTETGVAFHGTYWHHNYGRRMSHGCINMTTAEAKWLYRWLSPETEFFEWEKRGYGSQVIVT